MVFLWHGGHAVSKVTTSVIHGWGFLDSKWSGTWGPAIDGGYGSARTNPRQGPFHPSTHVRQAPYSCPPDQPRGRWEVTAFLQVHSFIQHLFMCLLSACLGLGYPKGKATRVGSSFRARSQDTRMRARGREMRGRTPVLSTLPGRPAGSAWLNPAERPRVGGCHCTGTVTGSLLSWIEGPRGGRTAPALADFPALGTLLRLAMQEV